MIRPSHRRRSDNDDDKNDTLERRRTSVVFPGELLQLLLRKRSILSPPKRAMPRGDVQYSVEGCVGSLSKDISESGCNTVGHASES